MKKTERAAPKKKAAKKTKPDVLAAPKTFRLEFTANNSGGYWWLKPEHWKALEENGWTVLWGGLYFCNSEYPSLQSDLKPPKVSPPCPKPTKDRIYGTGMVFGNNPCKGHRYAKSYAEAVKKGCNWLGALAKEAWIDTDDVKAEIQKWERLTGQDASDEGCNCCGQPHDFSWRRNDGDELDPTSYLQITKRTSWEVGD